MVVAYLGAAGGRRDVVSDGRRATALLAHGAAVGLAAALAQLVHGAAADGAGVLPPDAAASVNGVPVARTDLDQALSGVAADRRTPLDAAERRRILDRLIDDEVLLQHALALGLPHRDPRARALLVRGVIDLATSTAAARVPSDDEVAAFYDAHRDWFTQPGRIAVREVLVLAGSDGAARAEQAAARLRAGESPDAVRAALGRDDPAAPPEGLMPLTTLREYVGPAAVDAVAHLDAGAVAPPLETPAGWRVLQVVAREPGRVPPLAEIADVVRAETVRAASDDALVAYIEALRAQARIDVADDVR